ncbi:MAG: GC-type dockerin domain-anchored protein [Phycisphaerales bacterium]
MWWSDTEGGTLPGGPAWTQTVLPALVQTPGGSAETFSGYADADVPGVFKPWSFPALAFHRADPSIVYLIFPATTPSAGAGNVDLIIMRSLDGGVSFSPLEALHITDAMLGLPTGIDQLLSWIAIDDLGGVNFIFTTVRENPLNPSTILLRNYYARFATFNAVSPSTPFVHATSAEFQPIQDPDSPSREYVRDYNMLDTQGCKVVLAQMAVTPGTGGADIYVTRVSTCAVADSDQDGALTANDPPTFAMQFLACDPRADVTNNGTIDSADMQHFLTAFACQCNPQP